MVSEMAMEDVEALRAAGGDVSPRDVVRLNALGLKVERAAHAPDFAAVPRTAELCGLVFREPTIAAEAWMEEACGVFDDEDWQTVLLLRALSLSKPSAAPSAPCAPLAETVGADPADVLIETVPSATLLPPVAFTDPSLTAPEADVQSALSR